MLLLRIPNQICVSLRESHGWYSVFGTVMGAAGLGGIVIGSLYDPNTAYTWAQEMKGNFEKTSLITTAFVTHGMNARGGMSGGKYENYRETMAYAKTCTANVFNYLLDTAPQPEDGLFCPAPVFPPLLPLGPVRPISDKRIYCTTIYCPIFLLSVFSS